MAEAVLETRALEKRYGDLHAVRDVSLRVDRGQIYGLLGPNGSGKTTTLLCALGLLSPTGGEARVLGGPARAIWRTEGRVGAVFDSAALLSGLTVRQNLEYARRLLGHDGGRTPRQALELVGIADLAPRRAEKLSLGQRKRVAIARALLGDPALLVLDEPLSALDPLGVRAMLRLVEELAAEGRTLVLSSHRLREMEEIVTHAGILAAGKLVRQGPLAELLAAERVRYRLRVAPADAAERVLDATPEVALLARTPGADDVEYVLLPGRHRIEALNRSLVQAGCAVRAIVPEAQDLQSLFETLVNGAPDGRP